MSKETIYRCDCLADGIRCKRESTHDIDGKDYCDDCPHDEVEDIRH